MKKENILDNIPNSIPQEVFETIIKQKNISIERIISQGHTSPKDFWYDQNRHEWVIVLQGQAKLQFYNVDDIYHLKKGDYINIPYRTKHRVIWTDPNQKTIWLAIHY